MLNVLERIGPYVVAGAKLNDPRADLKRPWACAPISLKLPEDRQRKAVWQNAAACLLKAAEGGDPTEVSVAIRFARMLDR